MPKIVITGVPGLNGEYPLELTFTHRDFHTIKNISGVRANEVMDAINAGDLDIIVAMAEIAMQRAGKSHSLEDLWDSEAGAVRLEVEEEEVPPTPQPDASENGSSSKPSGDAMSTSTEDSPETSPLSDSGIPEPVST